MLPRELDMAIIAPFPNAARIQEGWMSRIATVDRLFAPFRRLYVHFAPHHRYGIDDELTQHTPTSWELCLNAAEPGHYALFDDIVSRVRGIYVHTVHLAEHVLPWLPTGKVVVDIHGIVPEEEIMLGHPELAPKYAHIEQQVLSHAWRAVVVTNAMAAHFRTKYPDLTPRFLNLPIFEPYGDDQSCRVEEDTFPVRVVYSGGTQPWQNIDAMLRLMQRCSDFAQFTFLSHDATTIQTQAERDAGYHRKACFGFRPKAELPAAYARHDFGMVLRDDTAVNRVACPTKLSEYLHFGLVPIVRSPQLGDFEELGYWYITEEEFAEGFFPDASTRQWMRAANKAAMQQLMERFISGSKSLLALFRS